MPRPFNRLTPEEFIELLALFPFRRRIDSVHMHHTWRPKHSQFRGLESIEAMWRFHTQDNGWSDIAQHITIDPEGMIWTGRNWNQSPASAGGHNGNSISGPFMFEMIGDFDRARDPFAGAQRRTAIEVVARVQMKFNLPARSLRFHNQMSTKSCPGSSIDYEEFLSAVEARRAQIAEEATAEALRISAEDRPFSKEESELVGRVESLLESLSQVGAEREDPPSAESQDDGLEEHEVRLLTRKGLTAPAPPAEGLAEPESRSARAATELTPEILSALRPHVINLRQGQFSSEGKFSTSASDVDAIFGEHLVRALAEARGAGRKLRLLFFAHGGLTSESSGLRIAHRQVRWWNSNNVYPIYFVWETGLFEILGQLLRSSQSRMLESSRDIFDFTSDPVLEAAARRLGGVSIWSGMKRSAELSVAASGGARYAARKLKDFYDANPGDVELHAMGHSAGSIFHAHFIPAALKLGVPAFQSLHFLAPAIRVDTFKELLAPKIGKGIDHLTIFTMAKDWERADNTAQLYRKSLLYLIHHGLEPERKTPILGLEESIRKDADLTRLLGLAGNSSSSGEVIWSKTQVESGRNASTSSTHGGFDEDVPTMNSALRRILNIDDTADIEEFPKELSEERALGALQDASDWEEELEELAPLAARARPKRPASSAVSSPAPVVPKDGQPGAQGGRRRALCVGINTYPTAPLSGCVADAQEWAGTLGSLGFETTLLINEQATHDSILSALTELVTSSRAGDVIAFQFAGHGTTLTDKNRDEVVDGLPGRDEALCPYDFSTGAFIVDDDVAKIFTRIPEGVNLTCFIDCCHSGTITRFAVGDSAQGQGRGPSERPRFIVATPEMEKNHRAFRKGVAPTRSFALRGPDSMREVLFSACLQSEVAWENEGHGDFTARATRILKSGANGISNEQFQQKVVEAFGASPRQHPDLDCSEGARSRGLLVPLTSQGLAALPDGFQSAPSVDQAAIASASGNPSREIEAIAQGFRMIADLLLKPR